jgi:ATP-binding cassette subfamily B protein
MVLQQPHLFSGTVRENIRYGRLDATDAEIEDAARMTNAHEFHHRAGEGLRHAGRRGRQQALDRTEAVDRTRPRDHRRTRRSS